LHWLFLITGSGAAYKKQASWRTGFLSVAKAGAFDNLIWRSLAERHPAFALCAGMLMRDPTDAAPLLVT